MAWHILRAYAADLGLPAPASYEDEFPANDRLDFAFELQLTPEMAEEIAAYERVCFVDAHTGDIPQDVQMVSVESEFQRALRANPHLSGFQLQVVAEGDRLVLRGAGRTPVEKDLAIAIAREAAGGNVEDGVEVRADA